MTYNQRHLIGTVAPFDVNQGVLSKVGTVLQFKKMLALGGWLREIIVNLWK